MKRHHGSRKTSWLGVVVASLTFAVWMDAPSQAAYMYTVNPTILSTSPGPSNINSAADVTVGSPGTRVQLQGKSGMDLNSVNDALLADLLVSKSTLTPSTDNFSLNYRLDVTVTNPQPPAPGASSFTFQVFGTMDILASIGGPGQSFTIENVYTGVNPVGPQEIGGVQFDVSVPLGLPSNRYFSKPTLNQAVGGLSARITAVPEPGSLVLLGLGGLGFVGFRTFRRKRTAVA